MTTLANNPYLTPYAETIDLTGTEPDALSPWAPRPVPVAAYRINALTGRNLENLCRTAYRITRAEAGKYEGCRLTETIAVDMTAEVVTALEMLRLAMIAHAEHAGEPTELLRQLDLSGVVGYFKRHIGES